MIPAAAGILAAGMMYLPVWWQNLQAEQEKENWIDTYLKPEDPAEPEGSGATRTDGTGRRSAAAPV